jgi:hypothetical protein
MLDRFVGVLPAASVCVGQVPEGVDQSGDEVKWHDHDEGREQIQN